MKNLNGFKRVTKATIKKAISESKYPFINFNLGSGELETALEDVRKGNKQVQVIIKILKTYGDIEYVARMTGYGAWVYRFNTYWTATDELISQNID